jgi:hypothetical protein
MLEFKVTCWKRLLKKEICVSQPSGIDDSSEQGLLLHQDHCSLKQAASLGIALSETVSNLGTKVDIPDPAVYIRNGARPSNGHAL